MIRNAQVTDSSAIQEINRTQLGYDCSLEQTTKNLQRILKDANHHYLLVYEDDVSHQVEGYLHAEIFEETYFEPLLDVLALAVAGSTQGKGIGTQLMSRLEELAQELDINEIRLSSGEERVAAHKFYEKLGYQCLK
ncbi:MAG: GNAT family N-acetyltransferase, partial [Lactobacillus apis]|nr:GNAT family N-acetyltransferase [Lactobacillus apis]